MWNEGGVDILLYLGDKIDPSWMSSKCHSCKKSDDLNEGALLGFYSSRVCEGEGEHLFDK